MQPDAEHHQHHADLGELAGELDVGDEARRGRADDDAGDEIADERRQARAASPGSPMISASPRPAAMVVIRVTSWGIEESIKSRASHLP